MSANLGNSSTGFAAAADKFGTGGVRADFAVPAWGERRCAETAHQNPAAGAAVTPLAAATSLDLRGAAFHKRLAIGSSSCCSKLRGKSVSASNSDAAPATVSGEPDARLGHWKQIVSGKTGRRL